MAKSRAQPETLAEAILRARQAAGLNQAELAAAIGCGQSYVAHVEAGRRTPNLGWLRRAAAATGARFTIDAQTMLADSAANR